MDEDIVGFPEEADNTQFAAQPVMEIAELHEMLREFIDLESIGVMTGEEFAFIIENATFKGTIRMFLTNDHVTNEIERLPKLFFVSGPAVLLDIDGEETGVYLQVGGQLNFGDGESDVQLGTLTVWRMQTDPEIGLLDVS